MLNIIYWNASTNTRGYIPYSIKDVLGSEGADHVIRNIATSEGSTCNSTIILVQQGPEDTQDIRSVATYYFRSIEKNSMEVIHFEAMKQLMEVTYEFGFSTLQHMI
jgi:hypothetical protein